MIDPVAAAATIMDDTVVYDAESGCEHLLLSEDSWGLAKKLHQAGLLKTPEEQRVLDAAREAHRANGYVNATLSSNTRHWPADFDPEVNYFQVYYDAREALYAAVRAMDLRGVLEDLKVILGPPSDADLEEARRLMGDG